MELKSNKLSVLYSYAYLKTDRYLEQVLLILSEQGYINLLIDSGAFTAYKLGKPIYLKEYIEACYRYKDRCFQYVMLDVLRDKVKSKENFNKMLDAGLNPMGVLTVDEDVEECIPYTMYNDYIGIPGGTMTKGDWIKKRFQDVYEITDGKAKIHGLGYVKFPDMYQLPLCTVDSSSWIYGKMFGNICYFNIKKGLNYYTVKQFRNEPFHKIPIQIRINWIGMGFEPRDIIENKYFSGSHSFNNYTTINANIDLFEYSRLYNRNLFFVCSDFIEFSCLIGIFSSRKKYGKVDYEYTKQTIDKLLYIYKKKQPLTLLKEILS